MSVANPEWALLAPALALVAWQIPSLGLFRPWRAALCLLVIALLIGPQVDRERQGFDLWVLTDRSESAAEMVEANLREWESVLRQSRGVNDRLFFVDFGREATLREARELRPQAPDATASNAGLAIQRALLLRDPQRASKLLLLSDGFFTDSLELAEGRLLEEGVPLDLRLSQSALLGDAAVSELEAPARVSVGESFSIEARISGPPGKAIPYVLQRNDQPMLEGVATLGHRGRRLVFSDRIERAASVAYTLQILPEDDIAQGNNRKTSWTQVDGQPRVLLVTNFVVDPVEAALASGGFSVDVAREYRDLSLASLTGASAVVINNVPAHRIPNEFLDGLDFFVRHQGGGLLMLGGAYSFGSGGYHGSAAADLLPVSMELKEDHKKLAVAMAIVVDRSGSMNAAVPGAGGASKMDLANAGAAQATQLLGELDAIAYIAVDTEAHVMVPLTDVGENRRAIIDRISRVASLGGGIYVYTGLQAGWEQLQRSPYGQRHLVLFADASDAEQPGEYRELIAEMVEGKTTVSVIALGTEQDPDADLLKDIALRGGGRVFFNQNAQDLPAIFTQETVAVARSAFIEETVDTAATAAWLEVASRSMDWLPMVGGYNLSYLKDGASAGLLASDDYLAPLVAFWQQGLGRAAAVTFPLSGEYSMFTLNWSGYGDFLQTLVRWLEGGSQPEGLGFEVGLQGDLLTVDLFYDQRWHEPFALSAPRLLLSQGGAAEEVAWQRIEPGRYRAQQRLLPGALARGAIVASDRTIPFGPLMAGDDEEWQSEPSKPEALRALARRSGGAELSSLAEAWIAPPSPQAYDLAPWILAALLLALLADVAATRLGRAPRPDRLPAVGKTHQPGRSGI